MSEAKKKTTAKKTAKKPRINKVKTVETPNLEQLVEDKLTVEEVSKETTIIEEVTQDTSTEKSEKPTIVEEFDWDTVSNNDSYSSKERIDLEKEYSATFPDVVAKQVIDGVVVLKLGTVFRRGTTF